MRRLLNDRNLKFATQPAVLPPEVHMDEKLKKMYDMQEREMNDPSKYPLLDDSDDHEF